MDKRIYGKKIELNPERTISFYNQRAKTIDVRKQEYTTVLLGDQDPEYAVRWDEYEKSFIIPRLSLNKQTFFLDLGCGIGRWADAVADKVAVYCGVDFSSEMISVAVKKKRKGRCEFYNLSFKDALNDERVLRHHYDVIIATGVTMYINDEDLKECYRRINSIVNEETIVYFEESVGKKDRLTLNNIWSDNLNDYYGAIYRTREEYIELIKENMDSLYFAEEGFMDFLYKRTV